MRHVVALMMMAALVVTGAPAAPAQTSDELQALRKTIEALQESQRRIEKELGEIKALLRARPGTPSAGAPDEDPKNVVLSLEGDPFKGERTAKLVLVDFTDFQ